MKSLTFSSGTVTTRWKCVDMHTATCTRTPNCFAVTASTQMNSDVSAASGRRRNRRPSTRRQIAYVAFGRMRRG